VVLLVLLVDGLAAQEVAGYPGTVHWLLAFDFGLNVSSPPAVAEPLDFLLKTYRQYALIGSLSGLCWSVSCKDTTVSSLS